MRLFNFVHSVPLQPALIELAEHLIANKRHVRNRTLQTELWKRRDDAEVRGALGLPAYAQGQEDVCTRELNERADEIWAAYRRVISDTRAVWSTVIRDGVLERISSELNADIPQVEDMARGVIVPYGHGFELFLHEAWPTILGRITAEIDLFGLRQRAMVAPLSEQLSAPRYSGPALHWQRAQAALTGDPPDLITAAREAVHAVEALANVLADRTGLTLGESIKVLRSSTMLTPAVARQMEFLWGNASNLAGVRHGSASGTLPPDAELEYVIDSAAASAKFLLKMDGRRSG